MSLSTVVSMSIAYTCEWVNALNSEGLLKIGKYLPMTKITTMTAMIYIDSNRAMIAMEDNNSNNNADNRYA